MNDQQAENLARLHQQLRFYTEYPEAIPYISRVMTGPGYLEIDERGISDIEDRDERWRERNRRKLRAQVRALRNIGMTIEKDPQDNGDLVVNARRDDLDFRIQLYCSGYCTFTETEVKERVAVVEVPDEVEKAYTRIEMRPVTKRVCVPLLAKEEVEDL